MLLDLPWQNIRINVHNSGDDTKQNHVLFISMHLQYIQYTMRIIKAKLFRVILEIFSGIRLTVKSYLESMNTDIFIVFK